MKIIDLLNKIANGEDVPKKILYKYEHKDFYAEYRLKWNIKYKGYYTTKDETPLTHLLADNLWNLNDEVEIIEDKKINKIEKGDCSPDFFENNTYYLAKYFDDIRDKINELIDEVNKLKVNNEPR